MQICSGGILVEGLINKQDSLLLSAKEVEKALTNTKIQVVNTSRPPNINFSVSPFAEKVFKVLEFPQKKEKE